MIARQDVPDVVDVAGAAAEPGVGVRLVDVAHALAADLGQALGGELLGADEVAVGGADAAVGQAVEPGVVHQPARRTPRAHRRCGRPAASSAGGGSPWRSTSPFSARMISKTWRGVFLVGQQPAAATRSAWPQSQLRSRPARPASAAGVGGVGGHGHGGESCVSSVQHKNDAGVIFLQEAVSRRRRNVRKQARMATLQETLRPARPATRPRSRWSRSSGRCWKRWRRRGAQPGRPDRSASTRAAANAPSPRPAGWRR